MANVFEATFSALGGDMSGLLDLRQQVESASSVNPYIQRAQQEQAQRNADAARAQLGIQPGSLDQAFQDPTGQGLGVDTGSQGLLADPIFAGQRAELTGAINMMETPGTSALGQSLLGGIMASAAADRRQQGQDQLALQQYAIDEQAKLQEIERSERDARFTKGQALESDYAATFGGVKNAVDQFALIKQSLGSRSPLGAVGSIFQLAKLFDPGSRTVTEGDVTTIQGAFPYQQQLSNALSKLQGQGWSPDVAAEIEQLAGSLAGSLVESNRPAYENAIERAELNGIDPRQVVGRYGLEGIYGPGGTNVFNVQGPKTMTTEEELSAGGNGLPPGTKPGRPPQRRSTVRETRGR